MGGFQNTINIMCHDSVAAAPVHHSQRPPVGLFELQRVHIVGKGMASGRATVDLVIIDAKGNKGVVMMPGSLFKDLAAAIEGVERRTMEPGTYITADTGATLRRVPDAEEKEIRDMQAKKKAEAED